MSSNQQFHEEIQLLYKMRNNLRLFGQQIHAITISGLPRLSATELTRSTWARLIKSTDLIPSVYRDYFDALISAGGRFPYTVLTPSFELIHHKTTEKLICDTGDAIHILEKLGNTCQVQCYPLDRIRYVEHRTMLLDSQIKISGITRSGTPTVSLIRFNTVTDYLLLPILRRIRLGTRDGSASPLSSELDKFNNLVSKNFKFMNYAKLSLLGGERVIYSVFQPAIRERVWSFLGKTYHRTIQPTQMSILTDQELIMIRENESRVGRDRYGGIWDYIPLKQIVSVSPCENETRLLEFSLKLPENEILNYSFADDLTNEFHQLLELITELIGENDDNSAITQVKPDHQRNDWLD